IECQWRIFFIDQQLVLVTSVDDAVTKSSFVQWHIVESKIRCCCIASQKDSHLPRTHPIVIESTVYEVVFSSVCSRETGLSGTSHHNVLSADMSRVSQHTKIGCPVDLDVVQYEAVVGSVVALNQ